ncbi:MAG: hypothetical protein M1819_000681 [Sarea resinae]|nr:MAG: hypothetical protein M1819_000681 [Sarea resinae]
MSPVAWLSDLLPEVSEEMMALLNLLATISALGWLLHRAWQIFQKPLPDLINILGLDVPSAPDVALAGIKAESITLWWKPTENRNSVVKHLIQVNGVIVGESSRQETSVTVTGLKPDHFYAVRVIATNASNFQTPSRLIRLKTYTKKPGSTDNLAKGSTAGNESSASVLRDGNDTEAVPCVRAHETPASANPAPTMTREHSGSHSHHKRLGTGRRASPANLGIEHGITSQSQSQSQDQSTDLAETEQTVQQLTAILEGLRKEQEEVDKQITEEDEEFEKSRTALIQERDQLRQALKEREDASSDLRKQVAGLDRANRSAQSKKALKEKLLQQKIEERRKMKEDVVRWAEEVAEMQQNRQVIERERLEYLESAEGRVTEIRKTIGDCQNTVKTLEEDIRVKGIQIKELEEERKKLEGNEDDEDRTERDKTEKEQEAQWEAKLRGLQTQYATAWNTLQQAEANYQQAQERLAWLNTRRASNASIFSAIPPVEFDPTGKKGKQRRTRSRKSRTSTISSPLAAFPITETGFPSATGMNTIPGFSPTFNSTSPFFNMSNGMAVPAISDQQGLSHAELDSMIGGIPMSPTADALLPSNLLGDEEPPSPKTSPSIGKGNGSSTVGPIFPGLLPGFDGITRGPTSPVSSSSRSPSVFSSPRESSNNLHMYRNGSDELNDNERRSIHSVGPTFGAIGTPNANPSGSSRLASLFGLHRQRGKTLPNELPPLGSLKASQSQSFPRKLDGEPGSLDPIGTRRRRGSHSGSWANPMANFLHRNSATTPNLTHSISASERNPQNRRRPFNMFSSKYDPLEPSKLFMEPPSPRPSSTYSFDHAFPQPSSDSQPFGWPVSGDAGHRSGSLAPLAADWSMPESWSRLPSRRGSVQHGSNSNLAYSMAALDVDALQHRLSSQTSPPMHPAPIGTRPVSSQRPATPKLNPAAPTFKTTFSRDDFKDGEHGENDSAVDGLDHNRHKEQEGQEKTSNTHPPVTPDDLSPPHSRHSRHSRDSHSILTQSSSVADSHDQESLDRAISETPSELMTSSLTPSAASSSKESFIARITRKSSSGKFIPWTKEKGSGLFSSSSASKAKAAGMPDNPPGSGVPSTPDELDEDEANERQYGGGASSTASTPNPNRSSISWSSLMRKGKRRNGGEERDKAASEASVGASENEMGVSEDGGEDD